MGCPWEVGIGHRPYQGEPIGSRRHLGQEVGESHSSKLGRDRSERATDFGRGIGLRVERVELARTARQKDEQDRLRSGPRS